MRPNHYMTVDGEVWFNDFRTMMWISQGVAGPCWECPELVDVFDDEPDEDCELPTCQIVGGVIYCETDCDFGFTPDVVDDNYVLGQVCPERYCPQINGSDPAVWGPSPSGDCGLSAPWYDPSVPASGNIAGYMIKEWSWFTPYKDGGTQVPRTANVSILVAADGADATCVAIEALYRRLSGLGDNCDTFTSGLFKTCDPDSRRILCGGRLVPGSWSDISVSDLDGYDRNSSDMMPRCCGARIDFQLEFSDPCMYGECLPVAGPIVLAPDEDACFRPGDGCCEDNARLPCFPSTFAGIAPPPPVGAGPAIDFGAPLEPWAAYIENWTMPSSALGLPKWLLEFGRIGDDAFNANNPVRQTKLVIWCADDLDFPPSVNLELALCVAPVWEQKAMILPRDSVNELDPVCGNSWTYQCGLEDQSGGPYTTDPTSGNHLWAGDTTALLEPGKTYHAAVLVEGYGIVPSGSVTLQVQTKELA